MSVIPSRTRIKMANNKRRKTLMLVILMAALPAGFATFLAQTPPAAPSGKQATTVFPEKERQVTNRNKLARLLTTAGVSVGPDLPDSNTQTYRELRIHWESLAKSDPAGLLKEGQQTIAGLLTRTSSIDRAGGIPRARSLELSPDQMLVVALDDHDAVRWWSLMIDPRLVRAEVGRGGEMQSENYYRPKVDFIVECPGDRLLKQLRFYRLVWNGETFQLELLGTAPLD